MSTANDEHDAVEEVEPNAAGAAEAAAADGLALLIQRGRSGADWFFWIAALSLVNTAITHFGGDRHFVVGLGVTQIVDGVASVIAKDNPPSQPLAVGIAVAFSVMCSATAALVGYMARNRWQVIFVMGMFVYLLDGLLFLLFQDWMSLGFHGFALFCMWSGFSAFQQLAKIERHFAEVAVEAA